MPENRLRRDDKDISRHARRILRSKAIVAEILYDACGESVKTSDIVTSILAERAKSITFLHRAGSGSRTIGIIEKRSRSRAEADFFRPSARMPDGDPFEISPRVYRIDERKFLPPGLVYCSSVFMEELSLFEPGQIVHDTRPGELAGTIARIAGLDRKGLSLRATRNLRPHDTRKFVRLARDSGFLRPGDGVGLERMT
jgi:hypothetical protein